MDERRVTFRFEGDWEVQYLRELPSDGDFVTHGSELWFVSRVETDEMDVIVVCERPHRDLATRQAGASLMQS